MTEHFRGELLAKLRLKHIRLLLQIIKLFCLDDALYICCVLLLPRSTASPSCVDLSVQSAFRCDTVVLLFDMGVERGV